MSGHVLRDNAKCINIAVTGVHTESVRSESVDLASQLAVQMFWEATFFCNLADEVFDELVQLRQHLDTVRETVRRVESTVRLDRF